MKKFSIDLAAKFQAETPQSLIANAKLIFDFLKDGPNDTLKS